MTNEACARAKEVLERNRQSLFSLPNVIGSGVGKKQIAGIFQNTIGIVVFVSKKVTELAENERIHAFLEEIPTDVRVANFMPFNEMNKTQMQDRIPMDSPTPAGASDSIGVGPPPLVQVNPPLSSYGSIGLILEIAGVEGATPQATSACALTAFHVLCVGPANNVAGAGQHEQGTYDAYQPASIEGGESEGRVYEWFNPYLSPSGIYDLKMDVATAILPGLAKSEYRTNYITGVGIMTNAVPLELNQTVRLKGYYGSGSGDVTAVCCTLLLPLTPSLGYTIVHNLFEISAENSSVGPGDSGGAIYTPMGEFIGIINGGSPDNKSILGTDYGSIANAIPSASTTFKKLAQRYTILMKAQSPDGAPLVLSPDPTDSIGGILTVQKWSQNEALQQWFLSFCPAQNAFVIINALTGQMIQTASNEKMSAVTMADYKGDKNISNLQSWTINPWLGGYFGVRPAASSDLNLNAEGDSWNSGTPIILYPWEGSLQNMMWIFNPL